MEIQLTPEREAQLEAYAREQGKDAGVLAGEAVEEFLDHAQQLADAVAAGRAAATAGSFLEHETVRRMIEQRYGHR